MTASAHSRFQAIRKFLRAIVKPTLEPHSSHGQRKGVVIHDPASSRAHDLDDPFFDAKVQERMAAVIAGHAERKK